MKETLLAKVANMTKDELVENMYRDSLTGIWNRRAFEQTEDSDFVAIVDFDSLKWINDNKGHRAGDSALRQIGQALNALFPDRVFRISGDEFVVRSSSVVELNNKLARGKCYSYGVGHNLVEADKRLREEKLERTMTGLRAVRGERPVYIK